MSDGSDWGQGAYEEFAPSLAGTAEHLVDVAAPQAGERAIDLGAGHGNATLPLARSGAHVRAIDPSLRLLGIAARRASDAGLEITATVAGAESLPLPDGDADLIVSNFGMIFSPDPPAAISEAMRVLAPAGRLLYTAWLPRGAIADVGQLMREALAADEPAQPAPGSHDPAGARAPIWHDPAALAPLIPGGAAAISLHSGDVTFHADSPTAWLEQQQTYHPMWVGLRARLGDETRWADLMERSVAVLAAAARPGEPFGIISEYVIVEIHPQR